MSNGTGKNGFEVGDAVRVLVAEDEAPLREAICDLIGFEPGMTVVGAASRADEAIEIAGRLHPDVAVVDVRMPGGGALAAQGIREQSPQTRVLALSAYEDQATVLEMLSAGAVGYLVKGISPVEIVEAIRRAGRGQASLSIDVITRVIDELANDLAERRDAADVVRRSEERFRSLVESAPDAVIIVDPGGAIMLVNAQTEKLFGYGRTELLGKPVETLLPGRLRERHAAHRADYLANPTTRPMGVGLELAGRRRDGSEFPVDISLSMIDTDEGQLITAHVRDITERAQTDHVRRKSEERFAALLESAPDAVAIVDEGGTIVLVNRQTEELFGYGRTELVGQPIEILLPERFRDRHVGHRIRYVSDPRTRPMGAGLELAGRRKDGSEFPVDISLSAIETEEGRLATAFIRDTTDRKTADDLRLRGDERLAALIESAPDAVVITDESGRLVLVNRQTEQLFGYARGELLGKPVETLLPEALRGRHAGHRSSYLADPRTRPMGAGLDLAGRRRDGSEFPVDISLSTIDTDEGRLVTAFVRDIAARRQAELESRQLAAIVESSDDAIVGKDLDGTILTWNHGAERMYGYSAEEVVGTPITILTPRNRQDELPEIVERITRGEEIEPFETVQRRKDGSELDVALKISAIKDSMGRVIGTSSIARDITQQKEQAELERDLAERQALLAHLVSVGEEERARIAGDIHDDSIQAITAAGMRLQILRRSIDDPAQLKLLSDLESTIQLSIERLRHLLFDLRPPVLDNEGLSAALEMYLDEAETQGTTRYRLEDRLRSQPPPETRTILYRIAQEALANVRKHAQAQNAIVALHEREGGYLVRVNDDGVGFALDDTKPLPGHLGLASMRERATLAGGWLRIEAAPAAGTTVEVWIPTDPIDDSVGSRNGGAPE